jgi:spermidine synthase
VYIAANGIGLPNMLLRALVAAICLLPPTALMGASLPAAARWIESTRAAFPGGDCSTAPTRSARSSGVCSPDSTCLRMYGVAAATLAAVAINLVVGCHQPGAGGANSGADRGRTTFLMPPKRRQTNSGSGSIYITIALSGASALGAEVVWTRLMGMMLGSTVYVFSIILAVFLIGPGHWFDSRRMDFANRAGRAGFGLVPDSAYRRHRLDLRT